MATLREIADYETPPVVIFFVHEQEFLHVRVENMDQKAWLPASTL